MPVPDFGGCFGGEPSCKLSSSCDSRPKLFQLPLLRKASIPWGRKDLHVTPRQTRGSYPEPFIARPPQEKAPKNPETDTPKAPVEATADKPEP